MKEAGEEGKAKEEENTDWYIIRFRYLDWNDRVKYDEMGRACSTNGGEEECIWDIGGNTRRKETTRKTKT
jgi:hypothetical protein